jgi:putative endonuclease
MHSRAELHERTACAHRSAGDAAEDMALAHLRQAGLRLVQRNYRTPGRYGGEIDLILRERDGTLVFVEVRQRSSTRFGGAAGTVDRAKRQRIIRAARHFISRSAGVPPCRFDVVAIEAGQLQWLRAAFDAS